MWTAAAKSSSTAAEPIREVPTTPAATRCAGLAADPSKDQASTSSRRAAASFSRRFGTALPTTSGSSESAPNRRLQASTCAGHRRPSDGSCTCRGGARLGPRRRLAAASSPDRSGLTTRETPWLRDASLGDQRHRRVLEHLEVALDSLAARRPPSTTASSPQPIPQHPQREGPLQRFDGGVPRVGHGGVDAGLAR